MNHTPRSTDTRLQGCITPRHKVKAAMGWILVGLMLTSAPAYTAATGPTIRLFPTTVLEDIKQTSRVAEDMESGLQETIAKLDLQQQLYLDSKCDGAESDPGCEQIARQLGATYLEMLSTMADRLPDMEHAVNNTRMSLEKRLRTEIGQKMTPWTMQEMLLGNNPSSGLPQTRPALRGGSGMRLSDRFSRYYKLVAHAGTSNTNSLAVIASDIYLDMQEASELIAKTREEINRATLTEQLNQSFGMITPEMEQVVAGVKSILFGDQGEDVPIAGSPPVNTKKTYRSPLSL